jgi:hypothetical protein
MFFLKIINLRKIEEFEYIIHSIDDKNVIRYDTIRYDTIRYDTIRYDTIRYDTIRYDMKCRNKDVHTAIVTL